MASGALLEEDGMETMQLVVAGVDEFVPADFNTARTNVDRILGIPQDVELGTFVSADTYGWLQGGAGVNPVNQGDDIYAFLNLSVGFRNLQDDIQAMCTYLDVPLRTGVGTDASSGDLITAELWNNTLLNIQDCWVKRFEPGAFLPLQTILTGNAQTWTQSLVWDSIFSFSSNESRCRAFFNMGGKVGVSGYLDNINGNPQNESISALYEALGDLYMGHNSTTTDGTAAAGITVTNYGVGFYDLASSTVFSPLVTITSSGVYSSDSLEVAALVNSVTNPFTIILRVTLTATQDGAGEFDDPVTASVFHGTRYIRPTTTGTGFILPTPTTSSRRWSIS